MAAGLIAGRSAQAAVETTLAPKAARDLRGLHTALAAAPRRRDFKSVPMILESADFWDAAALRLVLSYKGEPKQSWDNTDLTGPWLNVMRNSMNAQIWGFRQPDFLCVSATHGPAHLALYDQATWDKYQLGKIAGGNIAGNTFIALPDASAHDPADFQAADGAFSAKDNSITALQRRGVVFLACHNAIWELAERLVSAGQNPDHLAVDAIAAELTNHLIPDVVLTPGVVGTLVELQRVGFAYSR
ncbi:MAG TPA: transcriptional initiation protein Tat [Xanthobacteraceae bacterium]|nr:transcriptional initiation protein Tat [Xanthobacteraceae bacterium]